MKIIIYGKDINDNDISEEIEVSEDGTVTTGRFSFKFLSSNPENDWIDIDGHVCNYKDCFICGNK